MGAYTPTTTFVDGTVPTAAQLNAEFTNIQTAVNAISSANLAADAVPVTALATDYGYYVMTLRAPTVGAGVIVTTIQEGACIPVASAKIVAAYATCTVIGGAGGDHYFDVYSQTTAASVLAAPKAMSVANTAYAGVVTTTTARALGEILTLRAVTPGGGSFTNLVVTILLKNQLVA
jgi:hypothetical protein